jgi:membrane fusion protein, heavy metal efflux system
MNRQLFLGSFLVLASSLVLTGCGEKAESGGGAPPPAKVEQVGDVNLVQVDNPSQFPTVKAVEYQEASSVTVTGVVNPDINRNVPVFTLATGRVVEIRARLGDVVKKGQVLLRVQSPDISGAFSDYRKAIADEVLANKQFERAKILYDKGAISLNDFQIAQDTEDKAKVDVETTLEHLRVLGVDPQHPSPVVDVKAPVAGVITDQQVTNSAGVQGLGGPNPFTISDLSYVWILCDVFENDLSHVHVGEYADIHLVAYPDVKVTGLISNIGAVLDPTTRTAKVRIEVANKANLMRVGMFVNATFHGKKKEAVASIPSTAILHLQDRDWVYVPEGGKKFRRVEVRAGNTLPDKSQVVLSGISPGQDVVANALVMQNTVEQ